MEIAEIFTGKYIDKMQRPVTLLICGADGFVACVREFNYYA